MKMQIAVKGPVIPAGKSQVSVSVFSKGKFKENSFLDKLQIQAKSLQRKQQLSHNTSSFPSLPSWVEGRRSGLL